MIVYRTILFQSRPLNEVLKYTDIRSYLITFVFILLSVTVPWIFHQFQLAGATFLPMHIFVLLAGFLFGWRAGLIVGICTPLASYVISGMPLLAVLPQVTIELTVYGLIAGLLNEKFDLRIIWSLLGAMLAGRIASVNTDVMQSLGFVEAVDNINARLNICSTGLQIHYFTT